MSKLATQGRVALAIAALGTTAVGLTIAVHPGHSSAATTVVPTASTVSGGNVGPQTLYIVDKAANLVYAISPNGTSSTVGTNLNQPSAVATDAQGNVYIADAGNNRIVKVTAAGVQSTVGSGLAAPVGVATDAAGDVFVSDTGHARVLEVTAAGVQTVLPFTGLTQPAGLAVDPLGDVFVADLGLGKVAELTPGGAQSTVGSGFTMPTAVALSPSGQSFVADTAGSRVTQVTPAGVGSGLGSGLSLPVGVATSPAGNLYAADLGNDRVVRISPAGAVTAIATPALQLPYAVALGPAPTSTAVVGTAVTLQDVIDSNGTTRPSGTVTFSVGSTQLGTAPVTVSSAGVASASLSVQPAALGSGVEAVTAVYAGDASHTGSRASANLDVVNPTSVAVTTTASSLVAGQSTPLSARRSPGRAPMGRPDRSSSRWVGPRSRRPRWSAPAPPRRSPSSTPRRCPEATTR